MSSADVTRFRLRAKSGVDFVQQESCWGSQQFAVSINVKEGPNAFFSAQAVVHYCCRLCKPLHMLAHKTKVLVSAQACPL